MKKLIYCICAAGLLVLGACGTKNNDKADEACAKCAAAGIEGKWVIDEILCGKQFVKPAAENGERMYISFAADSTVNCYAGCNAIGGAYFVAGDSIRFDYMMRTEMACPDMEVEDTISVMLPRVATFAIEGDTLLKLNTATPGEQIVLSRAAVTEE